MRRISDDQRRARLAVRHALAQRVGTVEEAVESVVCLHATEPHTVYLSLVARTEASARSDIERALYADRSVVKQLAMRRTVFAFPRSLLPAVWGSASARVAQQLRTRLAKEVESNGLDSDGAVWVTRTHEAVLGALADGPATTAELRARLSELELRLEMAPGKSYGGSFTIAPRVLSTLAAHGSLMRGTNNGDWRLSRPRWTLTEDWLGEPARPLDPDAGYRELIGAWLRRFGPGTENDLVWWLGATKGVVRRALVELEAVEIRLADRVGFVLPDDVEDVPEPEPWAALLPVLDPTVMGWKERDFYLDPGDVPHLFDTNGNAGTTAWWGGQIVGCWAQDEDGAVSVILLRDVGSEARAALDLEAERLTTWFAGDRIGTVYPSPLMKTLGSGRA